MTIADTIFDTINDNWGSGGYAGATPAIDTTETQTSHDEATANVIEVRHHTLREIGDQRNDVYVNRHYNIDVYVTSKTSNAQLKLLYDEVEYLLRNTAMTGLQLEKIDKDWGVSQWEQGRYSVVLKVGIVALLSSGAVTSAAGVTDSMQSLLMYGSANAAWVPCVFSSGTYYNQTWWTQTNSGSDDPTLGYVLPLPTTKGSLKLYVSGVQILLFDADANNYVTQVIAWGVVYSTQTALVTENANRTAAGKYTTTATAADASSYDNVTVWVVGVTADANALDIAGVSVKCYYA